ncbi:MAG: FAD-dependent oxidoreductase [Candidatus Methanospirare jalkutatii]|nr:FAD-dependent oxidoreductase [Candidatus Methanospirare jalkutatii]
MAIAVIGGGVAGIHAALTLANSGYKVYLIERSDKLGGKMSELAECETGLSPSIAEVEAHPNIEVMLSSEVEGISGSAGSFKLRVSGRELEVASVILTPGYDIFEEIPKSYAIDHPDVVTSLEFERILREKKGELTRPSDGKKVKRLGFIKCIGSRCKQNEICSSACCGYTAKEAKIVLDRYPDVEIYIFYMDVRTFQRYDEFFDEIKGKGAKYIRSRVPEIIVEDGKLLLKYENLAKGTIETVELDMVVLAVGLLPSKTMRDLATKLGVQLDEFGFVQTKFTNPVETNVSGIFVGGAARAPMMVADSVAFAEAAAAKAARLSERDGVLPEEREYVAFEEEPRVSVIINSMLELDRAALAAHAEGLGAVVHVSEADTAGFSDAVKQAVERGANRIVAAGFSPRKYESLLRDACAKAGLNPFLMEVVGLEQCLAQDGERATENAKKLVEMGVEKVKRFEEVVVERYPVVRRALVVGGGISGMQAALDIANAGYEVYLVEKEAELGGYLREAGVLPTGESAAEVLNKLKTEIQGNERIKVLTNAEVLEISGRPGEFKARIKANGEERELDFGACVLATGTRSFTPTGFYNYGTDEKVKTQLEFEKMLASGSLAANTIVMIQCVGWGSAVDYCSKVCCVEAVKNALLAKKLKPEANVFVLYREMRTYGKWEMLYKEARQKGVIFLRYDKERPPKYENGIVSVFDVIFNDEIQIKPDIVVLSTPLLPAEGNERLAEMLHIATKRGFFLPANERPKMRTTPVETAKKGVFVCGSAVFPAMLDECLAQASAAAAKACEFLSQPFIEVGGVVSTVDEQVCAGCGTCVNICPFKAIELVEEVIPVTTYSVKTNVSEVRRVARVQEALCNGCGACAGACPSSAISLKCFKDTQVYAQIDYAF